MSNWISAVGADALVLFWWPIALWTVVGLILLAVLRLVPERYAREQYEIRTALLAGLPIGLVLAAVFRSISADPLLVVTLPYEIVVRASGAVSSEIIDLSSIAGVSTGSLLLAIGVAAAALFGLISLISDIFALGRFQGSLKTVSDPTALSLLDGAQERHAVSTPVRLVFSPTIRTPAAFGWLHPTVVIPESMISQTDELRLVLLHETAHLARGDFALDTLARVVRTLLGWHPLVAHVFRTHAFWREAACDLAVITAPEVDRSAYARLLLAVSSSGATPKLALVASMTASPSQLTKRIEAMTRIQNPQLTLPLVRRLLVFVVLAGVVTFTACTDSTPAAVEVPTTDDAPIVDIAPNPDDPAEAKVSKDEDVFVVVEDMPELIGGLSAIGQSIVYPEAAKKEKVEGRVIVSFVVEKNGTVTEAEVVKGVDPRLDAEALRAVQTVSFEPGRQR
jgi:TonB family protein